MIAPLLLVSFVPLLPVDPLFVVPLFVVPLFVVPLVFDPLWPWPLSEGVHEPPGRPTQLFG